MNKQEKIRKFISLYLRQRFTTNEMPEDECDSETEFILRYLHEQDVVVKTEIVGTAPQTFVKCDDGYYNLLVATEPLIKEEK